ncbi:hypothetical protein ACRE_034580 [Hapsidospora chrysogenum ATCC 11550]|uniref:Uncharacterized protein n=1 Tax=Hapsidospora chrysogenum (strain ATCC 11550 / CBS 779.69 / DSM 880 / IAM 14645 / JCM 23072 / IMI 49137) TaxID=857340 RepID=A0A086T8P1_HAPC1|nr:hypothetical protein ACRE_034580 [Hapsidospora chrysogenum ATCC 11550]
MGEDQEEEEVPVPRWCMRCLRSTLLDWHRRYKKADSPFALHPISFDCKYTKSGSIKCDKCRASQCNCKPAAAMLNGDRLDLCNILQVLEDLCVGRVSEHGGSLPHVGEADEGEGGRPFVLAEVTRRRLAQISYEISSAFSKAETQHRKKYGITGSKITHPEFGEGYENFCHSRRDLIRRTCTPLPASASWEDRRARESHLRLRLQPRDGGYHAWKRALAEARQGLVLALTQDPRGRGEYHGAQWWIKAQEEAAQRFPPVRT